MKAIVYQSNTGHTAAYAQLLSERVGLPAWTLAQASAELRPGDEILFLGWVLGGRVQGLKRARARYQVRAVCAVGVLPSALPKLRAENGGAEAAAFLSSGRPEYGKAARPLSLGDPDAPLGPE